MDLKSGTLLVPPAVKNSSCSHPRYTGHSFISQIGLAETIEAFLIFVLTLGVIGANILVIFVINNRRYSQYIHQQPRYLLTSLALNDLAIGLLITPFGLIPSLFHCWPYGEIFCQIQALLRGALSQQSAVILVCMAVDRYMCALHPTRYHMHSSKKGCVAILSLTWVISLTVFGCLVLPKGYYFNNTGLMACEPFYYKPSYRILATCALYFPTTMVLMYCYGSSFHMSRFRLNDLPPSAHPIHQFHQSLQSTPVGSLPSTIPVLIATANTITKKVVPIQERTSNGSTSRSMAAISLGFIVMVTPWTIQEIVTACTNSKLPPFLDFLVTWTALSNSFWNPFLYWLLNAQFRRLSRHLCSNRFCPHTESPEHKSHCCSISADCDASSLPIPPGPPSSRPPQIIGMETSLSIGPPLSLQRHHHQHHQHQIIRPDIEGLSEKYWGEILERTVSSNSLHALQKSFSQSTQHLNQQQHHHQHHQHYQHHPHHQIYQHQHQYHQQNHEQQQLEHQQHLSSQQHLQQQQHHQQQHHQQSLSQPSSLDLQQQQHHTNKLTKMNSDLNLTIHENGDHHRSTTQTAMTDDEDDNNEIISKLHPSTRKISASIANLSTTTTTGGTTNANTSSTEQKLCEHIYHDVNCAKTKAAAAAVASSNRTSSGVTFNGCHNEKKNLPDI
ncbi:beta-3 adrenergic receptor isoform X2 [Condylostylus longicornis]|nr:beta-3 adrenergic receptor isoform X2 [Condylostylus longicornis]